MTVLCFFPTSGFSLSSSTNSRILPAFTLFTSSPPTGMPLNT